MKAICIHCQREKEIKARGLCKPCWINYRDRYPGAMPQRSPNNLDNDWGHEPTEEELEALIAAQRPTMPGRGRREHG